MQSWLQFHYKKDQENSAEHILHCFDYIRMGLICTADQALEGSDPFLAARGVNGTQRLGTKHVCRDWKALLKWVDRFTEQME